MKPIRSAWFAGLFVVLSAPGALAQSAGEAGAPVVEAGGAGGIGGAESGGDDSGGDGGEPEKPVPIVRKYELLENDARACSFGAPASAGTAARWWRVAAGLSVAVLRRRRLR